MNIYSSKTHTCNVTYVNVWACNKGHQEYKIHVKTCFDTNACRVFLYLVILLNLVLLSLGLWQWSMIGIVILSLFAWFFLLRCITERMMKLKIKERKYNRITGSQLKLTAGGRTTFEQKMILSRITFSSEVKKLAKQICWRNMLFVLQASRYINTGGGRGVMAFL